MPRIRTQAKAAFEKPPIDPQGLAVIMALAATLTEAGVKKKGHADTLSVDEKEPRIFLLGDTKKDEHGVFHGQSLAVHLDKGGILLTRADANFVPAPYNVVIPGRMHSVKVVPTAMAYELALDRAFAILSADIADKLPGRSAKVSAKATP